MAEFEELVEVLKHLLLNKFAPKPDFIRGILGDGLGNVLITDRPDYNLVRFNRSSIETFEIFNKEVTAVDGWPVLIGEFPWQPGLTQVVGTDLAAYEQSGWGVAVSGPNAHAPTHEWPDGSPGSDPLSVYMRAIVPLRAYSAGSGSSTVFVNSYEFDYQETGTIWPGVPGVDLSPVMSATATGTARFVGVYLDPGANTLGVVTGTTTVHTPALDPPLIAFPAGMIPSARIKVFGGQADIGDADIRDARRPFVPGITGSAGGGAPTGPAGGDLTGSYPNPTVKGLQTQPVSSASPAEGEILMWTGSIWQPHAIPATVPTGLAGGDLTGSFPDPQVAGLFGSSLLSNTPAEGDILMFSGTAWQPLPAITNVAPRPTKVNIGATEYDTITAAVAAAVAGDLIWAGVGTYTESALIPANVDFAGMGMDVTMIDGAVTIAGGMVRDMFLNRDGDDASDLSVITLQGTCYLHNLRVTGTNIGAGDMNGIVPFISTVNLMGGIDVVVDGTALNCIFAATIGGIGNRLSGAVNDADATLGTVTLFGTVLVNGTSSGVDGWVYTGAGDLLSLGGLFDLNGLADGLVLDTDGDTTISAPSDDQIDFETGGADRMTLTDGRLLLAADVVGDADVWAFRIKNTSGATADAGDVGFTDEAGEYQTTTTAQDDVAWCVVTTGGANNADIYVARRGRVTVNYTGSAPSAGDFLVTSTTAGSAQAQATMRPEIFAVCVANGAGGTVEALLLTGTRYVNATNSLEVLSIVNSDDSDWRTTINGAPAGAVVTYTAPLTSGAENTIVPRLGTELGKLRLYNETRSNYALIDSVNIGANTITLTANAPGDWVNTDVITTRSQTADTGASPFLYDVDLSSDENTVIPLLARALQMNMICTDTGATGGVITLHPWETYSVPKRKTIACFVVGEFTSLIVPTSLIQQRYCVLTAASGAGTADTFHRLAGWWEATP